MLAAMAQALLTLLGAAAEEVGLDRRLKTNTGKRRAAALRDALASRARRATIRELAFLEPARTPNGLKG